MTLQHHYVDFDDVRLHYVDAGDGPLILFVHGFPEFWYAWQGQLDAFSCDHHAVALDLRGHNLSGKPTEVKAYRPKHLVADLRRLIDHLGGRPAIVVAHDWGGAAAWNLAAEHPEYVEKLVIINSPHPVTFARELRDSAAQQKASQYMLWLRRPGAAEKLLEDDCARLAAMLSQSTVDPRWLTPDLLARYREAWSQPGALDASLNFYRATPLHPPTAEEPGPSAIQLDPAAFAVRVPTLVIWGERDTALLPGLLDGLDALVPQLTVKRIPDGSHWVIHERPEEVSQLIREFIDN
ncbi:MAG: alpha/beta hydrolase [Zoogloeaceae bacterium]|nr:alpha/beta hydrolase [Zoogloeaceae bacterium]MCK6384784.1 alpha/beta hydrolase [Rhodocyclaceae bacterium]